MDRHLIQFPTKHLALREDVHQLGVLVGEMLREQGGAALYEMVEGDRQAAIGRGRGTQAGGCSGCVSSGCSGCVWEALRTGASPGEQRGGAS